MHSCGDAVAVAVAVVVFFVPFPVLVVALSTAIVHYNLGA